MTDYSRELWYIGKISRGITNELLLNKPEGLYLVRDSSTCQGDFVLCVSENHRVSNYIINSRPNGHYKIGENIFNSLQSVLKFYTDNLLDTTTLRNIVVIEKVKGKYDFPGRDEEDLPFKKGELLYVLEKPEEQWWEALNQEGKIGSIPAPYVVSESTRSGVVPTSAPITQPPPEESSPAARVEQQLAQPPPPPITSLPPSAPVNNTGPVTAVAIMDRHTNAYDQKFLAFKAGDIIKVTKQNENGLWEGECNGRTGLFPFNHVKIQDN